MIEIEERLDKLYRRLREGRKCIRCGKVSEHVHHIVGRSDKLLRWDYKNLLAVCSDCHREIHDVGGCDNGLAWVDKGRASYLLEMKNKGLKSYLLERGLTYEEFLREKEEELFKHIGRTEYEQNTSEWEDIRTGKIGASEIACVIKSFVSEEKIREIMGEKAGNSFINEELYNSGYIVYHRITKGYKTDGIPGELGDYGHAVEKYLDWKKRDRGIIRYEGCSDYIIREDLGKYCGCSPDGYGYIKEDIGDINGRRIPAGCLLWEKKTVNPWKAAREKMAKEGLPWQYIIQLQYQMLMKGAEGGIISSVELAEDTPFNRGKITALCEVGNFEDIEKNYTIEVNDYIYAKIPEIEALIWEGLRCFEEAIKEKRAPEINKKSARLAMEDFKCYQTIYKGNPDGIKLATSQEFLEGVSLEEYVNDYIGLNEVIKNNNNMDKIKKTVLKKYLYDNNLKEIYTVDGGRIYLDTRGSLQTRSIS